MISFSESAEFCSRETSSPVFPSPSPQLSENRLQVVIGLIRRDNAFGCGDRQNIHRGIEKQHAQSDGIISAHVAINNDLPCHTEIRVVVERLKNALKRDLEKLLILKAKIEVHKQKIVSCGV